jgi:hypothetical protein
MIDNALGDEPGPDNAETPDLDDRKAREWAHDRMNMNASDLAVGQQAAQQQQQQQ